MCPSPIICLVDPLLLAYVLYSSRGTNIFFYRTKHFTSNNNNNNGHCDDEKKISPSKNSKLVTKTSQPSFVSKNHSRSNSFHKKNTLRRTKSTFLSSSNNTNNTNNVLLNFKFDSLNLNKNGLKFSLARQQQNANKNSLDDLASVDVDDLDDYCVPTPLGKKNNVNALNDISDIGSPCRDEISSPLQRRPVRRPVRRIHSMYYNPNELNSNNSISKGAKSTTTTPIDDEFMVEDSYLKKSQILTFYIKSDTIPRITVNTLVELLDGNFKQYFDKIHIVDCRFEYEYQGGHINGSMNINSQQQLEETFLNHYVANSGGQESSCLEQNIRTLMVFHCEFSSYRGPHMALHLRKCDRIINKENYPYLNFPNIVVLEGGYKSFFNLHASRCFPQCYVEMNDAKFKLTCEIKMDKFREDHKKTLTKASSFHFGSTSNNSSINSNSTNQLMPSLTSKSTASLTFTDSTSNPCASPTINNNTSLTTNLASTPSISNSTRKILNRHRRHNTLVTNNVFSSFETNRLLINEKTAEEEIAEDGSTMATSSFSSFSSSIQTSFKFPLKGELSTQPAFQRRLSECTNSESLLQKSFADILEEKNKKLSPSEYDEDDEYNDDSNKLFSKYPETSDSESETEVTSFHLLANKNSLSNIDLCIDSPTIRRK